jgi:hypothetical protein
MTHLVVVYGVWSCRKTAPAAETPVDNGGFEEYFYGIKAMFSLRCGAVRRAVVPKGFPLDLGRRGV